MAEDISPELYRAIKTRFDTLSVTDKKLVSLNRKIYAGTATQQDIAKYTELIGKHASDAFKAVLKPENLPNGTLYYNIAEKTIKPLMLDNWGYINNAAVMQQAAVDKAIEINIGIVKGGDPEKRINPIIDRAVNAKTGDELKSALSDPVITGHLEFYDDFMKENAKLRSELGLYAVVERIYDGVGLHRGTKWAKPCKFCEDRALRKPYEESVLWGMWERHPGCKCTILYTTERFTDVLTTANKNEATRFYQ